jgi:hypothetical protein
VQWKEGGGESRVGVEEGKWRAREREGGGKQEKRGREGEIGGDGSYPEKRDLTEADRGGK